MHHTVSHLPFAGDLKSLTAEQMGSVGSFKHHLMIAELQRGKIKGSPGRHPACLSAPHIYLSVFTRTGASKERSVKGPTGWGKSAFGAGDVARPPLELETTEVTQLPWV